jgi:hypothetical protein
MRTSRVVLAVFAGMLCAALGGCAHSTNAKAVGAAFDWSQTEKKILVVQPDINLGELTAGGLVEPRADWTTAAKGFVGTRLNAFLARKKVAAAEPGDFTDPHEVQLTKLHDAVGGEIIVHIVANIELPNKKNALNWTLGPGAAVLRDHYGADYALFMHVNDTYSSAGRKALEAGAFVACVITSICVIPGGGNQVAFVSLVDLRTGQIVWFNFRTDESGDLRNDKDASKFVEALLKDIPL